MPNSTTVSGEEARKQQQNKSRGAIQGSQVHIGVITEVHETLPLVKARYLHEERLAANGRWIPLIQSVLDIVQRFGDLRPNLTVIIFSGVESEHIAFAQVVGFDNEYVGAEPQKVNDIEAGPYAIFTPGSTGI